MGAARRVMLAGSPDELGHRQTMFSPSRYLSAADDTPIAYRTAGRGSPLLLANGVTTSDFFWKYVHPRWCERHRVVNWDYKGHGDSGAARSAEGVHMAALVDDLRRVMDANGIERAPLIGFSMGVQLVLEAYRHMPERVSGLVCVLGPPGRLFDTALGPLGPLIQRVLTVAAGPATSLAASGAGHLMRLKLALQAARSVGLCGPTTSDDDLRLYVEHFARMHFPTVRALALSAGVHDASPVLDRIDVPVLIVAGQRDVFAPAEKVGIPMHHRVPGSELLLLPQGTHASLFEDHDAIGGAVEDFVARL